MDEHHGRLPARVGLLDLLGLPAVMAVIRGVSSTSWPARRAGRAGGSGWCDRGGLLRCGSGRRPETRGRRAPIAGHEPPRHRRRAPRRVVRPAARRDWRERCETRRDSGIAGLRGDDRHALAVVEVDDPVAPYRGPCARRGSPTTRWELEPRAHAPAAQPKEMRVDLPDGAPPHRGLRQPAHET